MAPLLPDRMALYIRLLRAWNQGNARPAWRRELLRLAACAVYWTMTRGRR